MTSGGTSLTRRASLVSRYVCDPWRRAWRAVHATGGQARTRSRWRRTELTMPRSVGKVFAQLADCI
jgi:hypothetical protein